MGLSHFGTQMCTIHCLGHHGNMAELPSAIGCCHQGQSEAQGIWNTILSETASFSSPGRSCPVDVLYRINTISETWLICASTWTTSSSLGVWIEGEGWLLRGGKCEMVITFIWHLRNVIIKLSKLEHELPSPLLNDVTHFVLPPACD